MMTGMHIDGFNYNAATEAIWANISKADAYITEKEPYRMVKSEDPAVHEEGKKIIGRLVMHLGATAIALQPFMPSTAEKILAAIATNAMPETLFPRKE